MITRENVEEYSDDIIQEAYQRLYLMIVEDHPRRYIHTSGDYISKEDMLIECQTIEDSKKCLRKQI